MSTREFFQANWRIVVVAVLGGLLAFAGSFLVEPTYTSSTRLLIHGRDATFLTSSGQDLTQQPGVLDSSLAKSLAETYGGIASSRTVATAVVDQLHLDTPETSGGGPVSWLTHGLAWAYRCGRAFVTSGFCADVDPREQAIADVQGGTTAAQLGASAGESAGQPGSFVLEVTASGSSPAQARDITDAVAEELLRQSAARTAAASQARVDALEQQVTAAEADVATQTRAISQFKDAHGITAADEQLVLQAQNQENMQNLLQAAQADLADTRAQLASTESSLAAVPPRQRTVQRIQTGRSDTDISTDGENPAYTELLTQRSTLRARVSGLQARIGKLTQQLDSATPTKLNGPQAQLSLLQQSLELAQTNRSDLTRQLQQTRAQQASTGAELTRIDQAGTPTYPDSPKRYLYLVLGLLIGAVAGGLLTWRSGRRQGPDDDTDADASGDRLDLTERGNGRHSWQPVGDPYQPALTRTGPSTATDTAIWYDPTRNGSAGT